MTAHRFLQPGHWTRTIPDVSLRLVNWCFERCPQPSTVHVNSKDSLGSGGSSVMWVWAWGADTRLGSSKVDVDTETWAGR